MKKMKNFIALTTAMALFGGQLQAQGFESDPMYVEENNAYAENDSMSLESAIIPVGALAVAAVLIFATNRGHHHSSSYSSSSSSSSSSHFHSHSSASCF
jgi:hypothetical protein